MSGYNWIKIADTETEIPLAPNGIAVMDVDGKRMCVGKANGEWVAFAYKCPHASGIMAGGYFDATGNVVCPTHRYKFNPVNGRNTSGEGYYLKTWPVEVREDGIFVGMKKGWFS
ncbi:MAG TPA: Rieske 2Fe-2S domain-containing protein [Parasegetibacter sp.]|jgi:nitrite reductase/ring-hydroxylating ferredoxin subunit